MVWSSRTCCKYDLERNKMNARILDGRAVAQQIRKETRKEAAAFELKWGFQPTLALVRAGDDPASVDYARTIKRTCEESEIAFQAYSHSRNVREEALVALVQELSADDRVHGIIVQKPMPAQINDAAVIEALDPAKDVDGAHPLNTGRLAQAAFIDRPQDIGPYFVPATPLGGMELLKRYGIEIDGRRAVIVAASNLVGKPLAMLLLRHWATATVCDLHTCPLGEMTRQADILCSATGVAHLITADMVKPGATVLDFGFARLGDKWVGDVDFDAVVEVAGAITPVPGGTGAMTNEMLIRNVLTAARRQCTFGVPQASRVVPVRHRALAGVPVF
jgi:methylenetetrahydrofolate dehydrogenase (NADP+)/methenyltetrahydrofolate cyclohydrolase